jgi:hypothetical protein
VLAPLRQLLPAHCAALCHPLPLAHHISDRPVPHLHCLQASEAYVEYDAAGRVLRGQEVKAKSRYEEDVLINNHTAVWGSWWADGQW